MKYAEVPKVEVGEGGLKHLLMVARRLAT